jgi:hypothetical protein
MLDRPPETGTDQIGYHGLTQAAMRGVVRAALDKVAKLGDLPGDHHFYVTFRTRMFGVQMDDSLKDRFPDEMTIVIQHQFGDFEVHDERFEITLAFGGKPQHLRVPFGAVTRFVDPSTNFGVQLEPLEAKANENSPTIIPATRPGTVEAVEASETGEATVVSLDAFRRK